MASRFARVIVDVALAAALILSMATSLIEEAPHEWIGVVVLALVVTHAILSRKAVLACLRKRSVGSIAGLALDALLLACLLGQLASSLVLSEHVLSWAPAIEGAAWARPMHMLCAYWGFALAFVHGGLHARFYGRRLAKRPVALVLCRAICIALALFGMVSFIQMGIAAYMTLQIKFAFADLSVPLVTRLLRWLGIGMAFACVAHYLSGVNVMNRLSVDCGCDGNPAEPTMADVGILASTDPVALDRACVDLVYAAPDGADVVERIESRNGTHTLDHAEAIGLGSQVYELMRID